MSGKYLQGGVWRPIATSGGGPPKADIVVSLVGASTESGFTRNAGDTLWDSGNLVFATDDLGYFFYGLTSITRAPDSLSGVTATNTSNMFYGCSSLTTVPLFNTAAATDMGYMFRNCSSLTTVPLFNTAAATNMGHMFRNCSSLTTVPLFNTAAATDMGYMFSGCSALTEVPALNMSGPVAFSNTFGPSGASTTYQLRACTRFRAFGARYGFAINGTQMDSAALNELMTNLGAAAGAQTLDIRYNPGSASCDPSIATAKGWTVTR